MHGSMGGGGNLASVGFSLRDAGASRLPDSGLGLARAQANDSAFGDARSLESAHAFSAWLGGQVCIQSFGTEGDRARRPHCAKRGGAQADCSGTEGRDQP